MAGFRRFEVHSAPRLLWGAYARRSAVPVIMAAAVLYLVLGAVAWSDGLGVRGMNAATATLHVAIGALGMGLLVVAVVSDRRRRLGTRSPGSS